MNAHFGCLDGVVLMEGVFGANAHPVELSGPSHVIQSDKNFGPEFVGVSFEGLRVLSQPGEIQGIFDVPWAPVEMSQSGKFDIGHVPECAGEQQAVTGHCPNDPYSEIMGIHPVLPSSTAVDLSLSFFLALPQGTVGNRACFHF
jgi:hypothetical protein